MTKNSHHGRESLQWKPQCYSQQQVSSGISLFVTGHWTHVARVSQKKEKSIAASTFREEMSDSADVHSQAVAAAVPHQQSTNPLQSKTGELHTKKKEFPAHAGWLVLFGEPFAVDPFKHQEDGKLPELDSEAKYIQRYNVLNANKAFDGYGLIVEVVTASGEVRVQQHIFVAKDPTNPNEEVELSDRKSLYAVIQDIKNELRLFLRPRFEERLRLRCIAEGIHSSNGGESLSDVLTSIGDASVRGMEQEIDAIKRIKRSLTHRPFIRKVVGEFFADKPYVPTITNEKISSYRGLDRAVLRKKSHPNWTGHYFFQQAMIECGKPLARKVSEKCPQAMLRASKKQKLNNASAKQSKSSSDSLKIRKIQVVLSGASPVEMLIPILQKVKAIIDQPADSSNEEDANPSNPNNTSVGGTSNEHENGILQDSELLEAAATAGIHLTHQGDVNQNLIPNIDENVIAEPVVSESTLSGIEVESMMSFCAPSRPQHQEDDEEESSEGEENSDGDEEIGNRNGDGATRRKETDEERDERIERLIDEGPSMMTKNNNDAKFSLADVSEVRASVLFNL